MKQGKRYAYVTFIIENDNYLPGIMTFAYALRKQRVCADLICVVTEDISEQGIQMISYLYDSVYRVEQIRVKNPVKGRRNDREKLFIRFAVLYLVRKYRLCYDKIIICDADVLPLRNFFDLCFLPAPSGILNEKKEHVIGFNASGEWIWYDIYQDIPPGTRIPKQVTDRVKTDPGNLGVNAAIYVFDSDTITFEEIANDLEKEDIKKMVAAFPWPEMQYITYKLSGRWYNLDIRYASFNSFPDLHSIYGTHYAGMKPWEIKNRSFLHYCEHEDYKLWICVFLNMMKEHRRFFQCARLRKLYDFLLRLVKSERKYVLNVRDYPELKHLLRG